MLRDPERWGLGLCTGERDHPSAGRGLRAAGGNDVSCAGKDWGRGEKKDPTSDAPVKYIRSIFGCVFSCCCLSVEA